MNSKLIFLHLVPFIFIFLFSSTPVSATYYYASPTGNDANPGTLDQPFAKIQTGVSHLNPGDTLYLRAGTYPEQIKINNLNGSSTAYRTLKNYPGESPVIDGQGYSITPSAGIIDIRNSSYLDISGLTVINSDDAAIYSRDNHHLNLHHNTTKESDSSGIGIWRSSYVTVQHNRVVNARNAPTVSGGGHEECISIASTHDFDVSYNEVYYEGIAGYEGGAGIDVKESSYTGVVHHNYTHDIINDVGIYIDAWTAGLNGTTTLHDIKVYNNKIFQAGGISLGSERGGTVENIDIYNNQIIRPRWSGIVLTVTGASDGGNGLRKNINIFNNTIYQSVGNGGAGIYIVTTNIQNIVIKNNLVAFDPMWVGQITLADPSAQNQVQVSNNLTYGRKACPDNYPNCYNYSDIDTDPQFNNPTSHDLTLKATSPAIDAGVNTGITQDYADAPRPQGVAYDIGAFEYGANPPPDPFDYDSDGDIDFVDFKLFLPQFTHILDFNRLIQVM